MLVLAGDGGLRRCVGLRRPFSQRLQTRPMFSPKKSKTILGWGCVVMVGLVGGILTYGQAQAERRRLLLADAAGCAIAFQADEMRALSGSRADLDNPVYTTVKHRLMRLRSVHSPVRFIYIFRHLPATGQVIFLADSEPADSEEISLPGDDFPEAPKMPGLRSILRDGRPATEGPIPFPFGEGVTGYALIAHDSADGESLGEPRAREILGIDLAAGHWRQGLFASPAPVLPSKVALAVRPQRTPQASRAPSAG